MRQESTIAQAEPELRTDQLTVAESVARIMDYLQVQDAATMLSIYAP